MLDFDTKNKYLRGGLEEPSDRRYRTVHNILKELGLLLILAVRARPPKSWPCYCYQTNQSHTAEMVSGMNIIILLAGLACTEAAAYSANPDISHLYAAGSFSKAEESIRVEMLPAKFSLVSISCADCSPLLSNLYTSHLHGASLFFNTTLLIESIWK